MNTSSFIFAASCVACLLVGLLIPRHPKPAPAPRKITPLPFPLMPPYQQMVVLDMRAKEDLERRLGVPISLSQIAEFLCFEADHNCLLFSIPMEDGPSEEEIRESWQRLKNRVEEGMLTGDTCEMTDFPDDHTSGGER